MPAHPVKIKSAVHSLIDMHLPVQAGSQPPSLPDNFHAFA